MAADEDFTENPFYKALMREFKDLHGKASERKCVICVPRASSIGRRIHILRRRAELGLHILTPSPVQHLTKGLYDCVQPGYSVIWDRDNRCIRGFRGIGVDFVAKILSEEQCYDETGRSFTLLVIDRPLGTEMNAYADKGPPKLEYNVATLSAASCEEFLRDSMPPAEAERIISTYKKSIEQFYHTYYMIKEYVDDLVGKLKKLVNRTLSDEILRVAPGINRKDASAALEVYGHNILYDKIFSFLREKVYNEKDEVIRKNLGSTKPLDKICGLDLSTAKFPTAEEFLTKMPTQQSPLQQLVCFARAVQGLTEDITVFHKEQLRLGRTTVKNIFLNADDTLSLIIHVICDKKIPYLRSMWGYISRFSITIPDASLQNSLTTFEVAVKFLENLSPDGQPLPPKQPQRARARTSSSEDPSDDYEIPDRMTLLTLQEEQNRVEGRTNSQNQNGSSGESFIARQLRIPLEISRDLGVTLTSAPAKPASQNNSPFKGYKMSYGSQN